MIIQNLIQKYKEELDNFFGNIPLEQLNKIFDLFDGCKGIIIISGVGKSALVSNKIAVTLTATGTRAFFLAPLEAMHGDVGLVSSNDLFVAISKSGETDELLNLLPYIRNKGAKIISITSNATSRLAQAADATLTIPFEHELCPFDMAPTISTTTQMIIGDLLAVALMLKRKFSIDEYAKNHPAGTIGKRITVRVKDLMVTGEKIPLAHPKDLLLNSLVELSNKKSGCLLIINENNQLLGIFTDGDLRRALQEQGANILHAPIEELMTLGGRSVDPESLAWDAMKIMENNQKSPVTVLPVVDSQGHVLGLLKMHDIIQSGI